MDELTRWIKEQQARGFSPQQILAALVQRGYSPAAANQAIEKAKKSSSSNINLTPIIIFSSIILILIILGIYFMLSNKTQTPSSDWSDQDYEDPSTQIPNDSSQNQDVNLPENPTNPANSSMKNCDKEVQCFIDASASCVPAKVLFYSDLEFFGIHQLANTYMEIRGLQNSNCTFFLRTENVTLSFPPGTNQSEIDKANEDANQLEGKNGVCHLPASRLHQLLQNWKEGNYQSSDLSNANCIGSYFE